MPKDCLVVIDMLNDFLDRWEPQSRRRLIGSTNRLIAAHRATDHPVLWVRQAFSPDLGDAFLAMRDRRVSITIEGTRGAEIHADLDRVPSDTTILKKRYSAFFGTDLDGILKASGVDRLTLAGVNTHACVRMTAIDAYQRDLRVTIVRDCVDSLDTEHGRVSLDYMDGEIALVRTSDSIIDGLGNSV